jgi:hypothetical protein
MNTIELDEVSSKTAGIPLEAVPSASHEPFGAGKSTNLVRMAELVKELEPSAQQNEIRTDAPVGVSSCACACAPCATKKEVSNAVSL